MLSCTVKLIKDGEEIFPAASEKITKHYQSGGKLPKKGDLIRGHTIGIRKSDDKTIYIHLS